jgi:hypothetical protein
MVADRKLPQGKTEPLADFRRFFRQSTEEVPMHRVLSCQNYGTLGMMIDHGNS